MGEKQVIYWYTTTQKILFNFKHFFEERAELCLSVTKISLKCETARVLGNCASSSSDTVCEDASAGLELFKGYC